MNSHWWNRGRLNCHLISLILLSPQPILSNSWFEKLIFFLLHIITSTNLLNHLDVFQHWIINMMIIFYNSLTHSLKQKPINIVSNGMQAKRVKHCQLNTVKCQTHTSIGFYATQTRMHLRSTITLLYNISLLRHPHTLSNAYFPGEISPSLFLPFSHFMDLFN